MSRKGTSAIDSWERFVFPGIYEDQSESLIASSHFIVVKSYMIYTSRSMLDDI